MTFNSDDLNFLVFRYLEEAGFRHTAYVFGNESHITHSNIDGTMVPAGGLVTLLQKALLYTEAELLSMKDEDEGPEVETICDSLSLIEAVMPSLPTHKIRKRKAPGALPMKAEGPSSSNSSNPASTSASSNASISNPGIQTPQAIRNANGSSANVPLHRKMGGFDPLKYGQQQAASSTNSPASQQLSNHHIRTTNTGPTNGPAAHHHHLNLNVDRFISNGGAPSAGKLKTGQNTATGSVNINNGSKNGGEQQLQNQASESVDSESEKTEVLIDRERVAKLVGHESEVFMCAWNPKADIIASGSGDSTARIWDLTGDAVKAQQSSKLLKHAIQTKDEPNRNKDVTSLDWNVNGELLATGCYDGQARVWNKDGKLLYNLTAHNGPIFALKWNPKGDRVLSAGVDKSTIVWDPVKGVQIQTFVYHTNSALDVDWIADDTFASCSTDQNIHVCKVGMQSPLKTFTGHANEVNAIRYDSKSKLLASCSDDMSLKIWSLDHDGALYDLRKHEKEIYTIRWSPLGNIIASASFDHTVKIWEATSGTLQRSLEKHTEPVYSIGFTPCGKYIATGSFDRCVLLWDVATGQHIMSYRGREGDGGIFDVGFNYRGDKIGASASDGSVIVLDLRYMKSQIH